MDAAPLTLGTAGHIDHGKTALIRALTGVDTDRLPEERERGISIELGYASLELPSGRRLSVVDAPGHERFVRTMVAGATGIDMFLMTIAADDGVMPQTREHAMVLHALGIEAGVVAVTKSDVADPEVAVIEAAELLPAAIAVPVSSKTGDGLDRLREALERVADSLPSRSTATGPTRLHIDRAFTIRGAGTVVTGTLWAGSVGRGDEVEILPGGRRARVRGTQVHGNAVDRAAAGQRVAVNLVGLSVADVERGDVLAAAGSDLRATYLIDAKLEFADREPEHGDRVQVHHGTRESPARLAWLGGPFWQIRLEQPLVPAKGDRLVIRQIAPPDTMGGGVVLDAHPRKHGPSRDLLTRLERLARGEQAEPDGERVRQTRASGLPQAARRPAPKPSLSNAALATEQRLRQAQAEPPLDSEFDAGDLAALRDAGRIVRVSKNLHYHADVLVEIRQRVIAVAERNGGAVTLAALRDELGTSRKFAQALLEHFDSERLTIRRGDEHVLRRGRR
jgi:selenocysteine-specific elongation factor